MRGLGSHGGRQAAQGMGCDSPTPWSHLSIGGHQYFRPPVQIDVGDQATEDTVKLVTARQEKLVFENLNTDKLNSIMRQDSLEPVLRDPCYLINEGICNRNIDQTMLSILLFFHR